VASALSDSAIRRLNGAGSLKRSDSIRNNCSADPQIPELRQRKRPIYGRSAVELRAQVQPSGTEFLDAETERQKSPLNRANEHGAKNPETEWPKMPAETHYLASYRNRAVCGDWMVVCAVICEPVSNGNSRLLGK
jgi:hypothetical protein